MLRMVAKIWRCDICGGEERQEVGQPRPSHPRCGMMRMLEVERQLEEHEGPYYEKWRQNMEKSLPRIYQIVKEERE